MSSVLYYQSFIVGVKGFSTLFSLNSQIKHIYQLQSQRYTGLHQNSKFAKRFNLIYRCLKVPALNQQI